MTPPLRMGVQEEHRGQLDTDLEAGLSPASPVHPCYDCAQFLRGVWHRDLSQVLPNPWRAKHREHLHRSQVPVFICWQPLRGAIESHHRKGARYVAKTIRRWGLYFFRVPRGMLLTWKFPPEIVTGPLYLGVNSS